MKFTSPVMKAFRLMRCSVFGLLAAVVALMAPVSARAQDNIGPLVYTVGTTWHETVPNRDWAYLLWLASDSSLLTARTFAIYAKPGDASSLSPYQRVGVTGLQTDTHVIAPLLQRAASIGEDLVTLEVDIDALFGKIIPAGLSRAEKISAVLRGAINDPNHYGKVMLLARTHPSVAMSMGVALAEPIGAGLTTFEIREYNNTTKQDIAVVGRVTVQANAPTVLPAPGKPVQVPRNYARGDLNVGLRWATPAPLLRLGLLQHGFNVYRVRKDYAEAPGRQWHVNPPTGQQITAALSSTSAVRRINKLPLITSKTFDTNTVGNFTPPTGDTNTVFVTDADDRGLPNYVPTDFTNGARFYYFVAARDILGRDGTISPGLLTLICDQLPPNALDQVEVVNDYFYSGGVQKHALRVNWVQANNVTNKEEQIVSYWIYRWTNISQIFSNMADPTFNLVQVVAHTPNALKNTYLDNGAGAPSEATALNRTYYYTVRCMDDSACGGNLSPHSAPVAGALRDRVGPPAPTGGVRTRCIEPFPTVTLFKTNQGVSGTRTLTMTLHQIRTASFLKWSELWAEVISSQGNTVIATYSNGVYHFPPGGNTNDWVFTLPSSYAQGSLRIHARCGSVDGQTSYWQLFSQPLSVLNANLDQDGLEFNIVAAMRLSPLERGDCDHHSPTLPGPDVIIPIDVDVQTTPTTREMKLYRRVDDGPLQFICQKTNPPTVITNFTCQDDSFPPNASEICYFAQLFDEHGNPSPMVRLGCTNVASPIDLPKPMLAPLTPTGDETTPQTLMRWFCPPAGVERFEIGIAATPSLSTNPAAGQLAPTGVSETHAIPPTYTGKKLKPVISQLRDFVIYRTPRIGNGSTFGDGAQFNLPFDSVAGGDYVVFVRAVAKDGTVGPRSNFGRLKWATPTNTPLPTVDWPARPLPTIGSSFNTNFTAQWMANFHASYTGMVVNVGYGYDTNNFAYGDYTSRPQLLSNISDPMDYVFQDTNGVSLFPIVLYRYQVPNAKFPTVSHDIIQVSPLMENIAYGRTNTSGSVIYDPFVVFDGYSTALGNTVVSQLGTYIKDTQPAISGSRYKYLLVRFQRDGEIAEVIPTNEVDVP